MLCPARHEKHGKPEDPSEFELNHICRDSVSKVAPVFKVVSEPA